MSSAEPGQTFGRWTVIRRATPFEPPSRRPKTRARVLARCVCGAEKLLMARDLTSGRAGGCASVACMHDWAVEQAIMRAHRGAEDEASALDSALADAERAKIGLRRAIADAERAAAAASAAQEALAAKLEQRGENLNGSA